MLSLLIDLLQRSSFRRSGTETCAGRSATPRKMSSPAAHLFDARRTLPPHSCQVPQCWAVGRTNGMKRSFFGAVAAARGRTEHSKRRLFEVRRSTVAQHVSTAHFLHRHGSTSPSSWSILSTVPLMRISEAAICLSTVAPAVALLAGSRIGLRPPLIR